MLEYNTVNAKLSDSQQNKLKSAVKNRQGTTLRKNTRMFSANNLPHELLLTGLPLIKNIIKPLGKSVLIPLGLTAAASAADAGIQKNTWFLKNNRNIFK